MKTLFLAASAIFLLHAAGYSQTKKIAFKSHSGNVENFSIALANELFDNGSNFGMAPTPEIKNAQLDSVIFVSDSLAYLVTSQYCTYKRQPKSEPRLWRAGREIAYHHPLFSKKHSLDSIRKIIKQQYYFKNNIDKVIFVGYDNDRSCDSFPVKVSIPVTLVTGDDKSKQAGSSVPMIAGGILFLSGLGGFISWKLHKPRLQQA
ncbi:MAG: hypothetical protein HOP10_11210 [Chitinophagaceae bacterium]|nr:hypothetical protein [Chitinophagaceae bacterium]